MGESLRADPKAILEALKVFVLPGQVVELRAPKAGPRGRGTVFGYYDFGHLEDFSIAAAKIQAPGVYFMLNPVKNDLLARCCNRTREADKGETTTDKGITSRKWLLIDVDANRPAGISATDEEKALALVVAKGVKAYLSSLGWSLVTGDSGNGYHLYARIDLPVEDGGLVKRVLEKVNHLFGTDQVKIDGSVCNPARITKLFGTISRKGDNTPDRPHRMSKLLTVPDPIEVVTTALLEALAGTPKAEPTKNRDKSESSKTGFPTFNVQAFIDRHGLDASEPMSNGAGGEIWTLKACPFREGDGDTCAIIQLASGAVWAGCQHDTCPGSKGTGNHWTDLRAMKGEYPSDNNGGVFLEEAPPTFWPNDDGQFDGDNVADLAIEPDTIKHSKRLEVLTWADFKGKPVPQQEWIWGEFLPKVAFALMASLPKHGKSILSLQIAVGVAVGLPLFGVPTCGPGGVGVLALEDDANVIHRRVKAIVESYGTQWTPEHDRLLEGNLRVMVRGRLELEHLAAEAQEFHIAALAQELGDIMRTTLNPTVLMFLDTLNAIHNGEENSATETRPLIATIFSLSSTLGCSVWALHHLIKPGLGKNAPSLETRMDPTLIRGSGAILAGARAACQFGWIVPNEAGKVGLDPINCQRRFAIFGLTAVNDGPTSRWLLLEHSTQAGIWVPTLNGDQILANLRGGNAAADLSKAEGLLVDVAAGMKHQSLAAKHYPDDQKAAEKVKSQLGVLRNRHHWLQKGTLELTIQGINKVKELGVQTPETVHPQEDDSEQIRSSA